jgi:hypothetical protein
MGIACLPIPWKEIYPIKDTERKWSKGAINNANTGAALDRLLYIALEDRERVLNSMRNNPFYWQLIRDRND